MAGPCYSTYLPVCSSDQPTLNGLDHLDVTSPIGRMYEVEISYPVSLHGVHSDLPFLTEISVPAGSKVWKLTATVKQKTNCIINYRNLKFAISNNLKVDIKMLYNPPTSPNTAVAEFADDKAIISIHDNPNTASYNLQLHLDLMAD
ncbi:Hypothetical protein CINCED_3A023574 [Cinara cedri]|uniref:Uncharacterized protein n=1 Tax=Cinara cedri TaxID=506608 RepID=A0A5E4M908_9HEMI|nr:Hypothetical protein CINCED_3A023574 [Cinara cedri]